MQLFDFFARLISLPANVEASFCKHANSLASTFRTENYNLSCSTALKNSPSWSVIEITYVNVEMFLQKGSKTLHEEGEGG